MKWASTTIAVVPLSSTGRRLKATSRPRPTETEGRRWAGRTARPGAGGSRCQAAKCQRRPAPARQGQQARHHPGQQADPELGTRIAMERIGIVAEGQVAGQRAVPLARDAGHDHGQGRHRTQRAAAPRCPRRQRPDLDHTSTMGSEATDAMIEEIETQETDIDHGDDAGRGIVELLDRLVIDQQRQGDDLAPMKSTMPNSFTVRSRQRLPPASRAGRAAGRMIWRMMRQGPAPRLDASICAVSIREAAAAGAMKGIDRHLRQDHAPGRMKSWAAAAVRTSP